MPLVELVLPAHNYYFRLQVLEGSPLLYWDLVLDLLLLERLLALLQKLEGILKVLVALAIHLKNWE